MEPSPPATRTIEVDQQVYDVLARTEVTRDTDINGALKYCPLPSRCVRCANELCP